MLKLLALSIFILIAFAFASADLSGQAGKNALKNIQSESNQCTLWIGVSAPAGHIVNDSQLIAGAWIMPIDWSSMETPSGSRLQEGQATGATPWVAQYFSGFDSMIISIRNPSNRQLASLIARDLACKDAPPSMELPLML